MTAVTIIIIFVLVVGFLIIRSFFNDVGTIISLACTKQCPFCRERIDKKATVCKFCRSNVPEKAGGHNYANDIRAIPHWEEDSKTNK